MSYDRDERYHQKRRRGNAMLAWRNGRLGAIKRWETPLRRAPTTRVPYLIMLSLMLITIFNSSFASHITIPSPPVQDRSLTSHAMDASSPLECLQVASPILSSSQACRQTLMAHTFGYSYGRPFIGEYHPPNCTFNRVTFNLTVTSAGRQFDRLALMFFDDIEIFRTSTAEPTQSGIVWTYIKDMSNYLSLFKHPQKVIFDLGNLVDEIYTASWNITLTATFFTAKHAMESADIILPISARKSVQNMSSAFVIPTSRAINTLKLPQNAEKLVFSISACGQAAEEFWWGNVFSSDSSAFGDDAVLYGHSPFRELQLFIDGHMAGVAWPFPIIFTGGLVPGLWRPIVGMDAFDLKDDEIDITPFIPLLSDDQDHSFEIKVVGIDDDGSGNTNFTENIESNWVVTGKVFVWLHSNSSMTTGTRPTILAPAPSIKLHSALERDSNGVAKSLDYTIQVTRRLNIISTLYTSTRPRTVFWEQNLTFSTSGTLSHQGNDQNIQHRTKGTQLSSSGYARIFDYPVWMTSTLDAPLNGNITIHGTMRRGKLVRELGELSFPNEWKTFDHTLLPSPRYPLSFDGSQVSNWQNGTACYLGVPAKKTSYSMGDTSQLFSLSGISGNSAVVRQDGMNSPSLQPPVQELYRRRIRATNGLVVFDDQHFGGRAGDDGGSFMAADSTAEESKGLSDVASKSIAAMLGRGPRQESCPRQHGKSDKGFNAVMESEDSAESRLREGIGSKVV